MKDRLEFEHSSYLAACRYRLDVYRLALGGMHYELHDLHSLDEHGFSQVVFEGGRREDVDNVVASIESVRLVG
jgi:hypothetical protein